MSFLTLLYAPVWLFVGWNLAQSARRTRAQRRSWPGGTKPANCFQTSSRQGNAFQELQAITHPGVRYAIVEQNDEDTEEEDTGDPPDPGKSFRRQARDIRYGREVESLIVQIPVPPPG